MSRPVCTQKEISVTTILSHVFSWGQRSLESQSEDLWCQIMPERSHVFDVTSSTVFFQTHTQSWDRAVEVTEIHLKVSLPLQSNASSVPRKELHFFLSFSSPTGWVLCRVEPGTNEGCKMQLNLGSRLMSESVESTWRAVSVLDCTSNDIYGGNKSLFCHLFAITLFFNYRPSSFAKPWRNSTWLWGWFGSYCYWNRRPGPQITEHFSTREVRMSIKSLICYCRTQ